MSENEKKQLTQDSLPDNEAEEAASLHGDDGSAKEQEAAPSAPEPASAGGSPTKAGEEKESSPGDAPCANPANPDSVSAAASAQDGLPENKAEEAAPLRGNDGGAKEQEAAPSASEPASVDGSPTKAGEEKESSPSDVPTEVPDSVSAAEKRKAKRVNSRPYRIVKRLLKITAVFFALLLIFVAAAGAFLLTSQSAVNDDYQITFYQVASDKINQPFRIALLSDLHNNVYGKNNQPLVRDIARLKPDLIIMAGDMVNSYEADYHVTTDLIRALHEAEIAPIYFGYGNHDLNYFLNSSKNIESDLTQAGAIVLRDKYKTISVNGNTVTIGGLASSTKIYKQYNSPRFIQRFEATEGFRLLICHRPEFFLSVFDEKTPLDADMALCGHAHGGQVRIPGIGALFAPDQGFLPDLTEGVHTIGECKVVISRGLGGRKWQVRINNKPELVVIDVE